MMIEPMPIRPPRRSQDATREERLEVLRMLEAGAITAEDAARLLEALDRTAQPPGAYQAGGDPIGRHATDPSESGHGPARHVRIRVSEGEGESARTRVNLMLPLTAIDVGLGIAERFAPDYFDDTDGLRKAIAAARPGPIIDVEGDDGERVQISIE